MRLIVASISSMWRIQSEQVFKLATLPTARCASDCRIMTNKPKKATLKQAQAVRCPTCGAGPGEKCELSTGQPRTAPHRDRRLIAKD